MASLERFGLWVPFLDLPQSGSCAQLSLKQPPGAAVWGPSSRTVAHGQLCPALDKRDNRPNLADDRVRVVWLELPSVSFSGVLIEYKSTSLAQPLPGHAVPISPCSWDGTALRSLS